MGYSILSPHLAGEKEDSRSHSLPGKQDDASTLHMCTSSHMYMYARLGIRNGRQIWLLTCIYNCIWIDYVSELNWYVCLSLGWRFMSEKVYGQVQNFWVIFSMKNGTPRIGVAYGMTSIRFIWTRESQLRSPPANCENIGSKSAWKATPMWPSASNIGCKNLSRKVSNQPLFLVSPSLFKEFG